MDTDRNTEDRSNDGISPPRYRARNEFGARNRGRRRRREHREGVGGDMVDGSGLRTRNREPGTENQELGTDVTTEGCGWRDNINVQRSTFKAGGRRRVPQCYGACIVSAGGQVVPGRDHGIGMVFLVVLACQPRRQGRAGKERSSSCASR
jgi:hypothetical protein